MMHAGSPKIEITVMGDSWKRQLVAPDDHSLCVSKVHKKIMFDAGASRLYHIIDAALCGSGGGVDTTHLFFPDNAADQFVTVSRLQQYSSFF